MRLHVQFLLSQVLMLYNEHFIAAKAIRGPNVRNARIEEFPFIASFIKRFATNLHPERGHFCTGSLVSRQNVLTGAHCLDGEGLDAFYIVIGKITLRTNHKYYPVWWMNYNEWTILMGKDRKFESNDLALIRLTEEVKGNITPAVVSIRKIQDLYGLNATTAGWGQTDSDKSPVTLKMAYLKILTEEECNSRVTQVQGENIKIHRRLLCTVGDPHAVVQLGDSGGPLVVGNEIVGVNYGTCPLPDVDFHQEKVNIHFSVSYYKEFFRAINR